MRQVYLSHRTGLVGGDSEVDLRFAQGLEIWRGGTGDPVLVSHGVSSLRGISPLEYFEELVRGCRVHDPTNRVTVLAGIDDIPAIAHDRDGRLDLLGGRGALAHHPLGDHGDGHRAVEVHRQVAEQFAGQPHLVGVGDEVDLVRWGADDPAVRGERDECVVRQRVRRSQWGPSRWSGPSAKPSRA